MIDNLKKFSSKYTESVKTILKARKEGKSVFIYNEYVQGSGLILFACILELFGFSKASGMEPENSEKSRYATLTNLTSTTKQLRQLVDRFNQPDNIRDILDYIRESIKQYGKSGYFNDQDKIFETINEMFDFLKNSL
jgi:hypothetical protein